MKTIAKRPGSVRSALGRLSRRQPRGGTVKVKASGTEVGRPTPLRTERGKSQGPEAVARGVIRRGEAPLLARSGTSYGLFDELIADYDCVLKSDAYRLGEYVGESVWISGSLAGVIRGMPLMEVTHLELLKKKWMH